MTMSSKADATSVWRMPLVLAALILLGLFDALLIDNAIARLIAWVLLIVPLGVGFYCFVRGLRPSLDRTRPGL